MGRALRVQTGCRDCVRCTGKPLTGQGRAAAAGGLAIATLAVSALMTRNCQKCGHLMGEHGRAERQSAAKRDASGATPPGWYPDGHGNERWWTGRAWGADWRPLPTPETQERPPADHPVPEVVADGAAAGLDVVDRIAQLGELRDRGLLTDAEFETLKARLLAP